MTDRTIGEQRHIGASLVIRDDRNQVLVTKDITKPQLCAPFFKRYTLGNLTKWSFPSGGRAVGETREKTLHEEMREETGVAITENIIASGLVQSAPFLVVQKTEESNLLAVTSVLLSLSSLDEQQCGDINLGIEQKKLKWIGLQELFLKFNYFVNHQDKLLEADYRVHTYLIGFLWYLRVVSELSEQEVEQVIEKFNMVTAHTVDKELLKQHSVFCDDGSLCAKNILTKDERAFLY